MRSGSKSAALQASVKYKLRRWRRLLDAPSGLGRERAGLFECTITLNDNATIVPPPSRRRSVNLDQIVFILWPRDVFSNVQVSI